jgi:WD40 repeat protein
MLKSKAVMVFLLMVSCISLKGMENRLIKVKTIDKKIVRFSESILENSTLLYKQYVSKKAKKIKNIIVFAPVDETSITLFKDGVMSLKDSVIHFKEYYEATEKNGLVRQLINVAGTLESSELTAHLVHNYFPTDISEYIASFVGHSAAEILRYKIIEKNCNPYLRLARSVRFDLDGMQDSMVKCDCSSCFNYQGVCCNTSGSVLVEVDSFDHMSPVLHCRISGRSLALLGHVSPIVSVHFSSNDALLLTCSYSDSNNKHCIILWDMSVFETRGTVPKIKEINGYDFIRRAEFSPSGDVFVVALENGIFRIYRGVDGKCIQYKGFYKRSGNKIKGISCPGILFGCDGKLLIMMNFGADSTCSLWNTSTGKRLCGLSHKFHSFRAGIFLANGYIVIDCSDESFDGECFDLYGEENRIQLAQFFDVMRSDMISVYAVWRWSLEKNNGILSDDESSLKE